MVRRFSAAVFAAVLVGGLVGVGVSPASAADPLTILKPNPNGASSYAQIELPDATRGTPYAFQLQAIGGEPPYTWAHEPALSSPWVEYGLTVNPSSGLISGTPPVGEEVGAYGSVQAFRVTDSAEPPNTTTISTRLWVQPYFRITTASLPSGVAGQPYPAVTLAAKGGQAPFKFSRGSTLPKGMKFVARTGVLFGTPKWGGQYSVTINVQDGQTHRPRLASKTFLLSVAGPTGPGGGGANPKPIIYGSGDVACSGPVNMKAVASGTQTSGFVNAQFKGRLTCQGSTGHPSVKIKTATVHGRYFHQGICSILGVHSNSSSTVIPAISLTWKTGGGKMHSTTVQYSSHDARTDGWHLPATNPAGTSQVTGSYAGNGTSAAVIGTSAPATLQGLCSSGTPSKAKFTALFLIRL